jgi:hypothetical protein
MSTRAIAAVPVLTSMLVKTGMGLMTFSSHEWHRWTNRYKPERHYMRGPGPKCWDKRRSGDAPGISDGQSIAFER